MKICKRTFVFFVVLMFVMQAAVSAAPTLHGYETATDFENWTPRENVSIEMALDPATGNRYVHISQKYTSNYFDYGQLASYNIPEEDQIDLNEYDAIINFRAKFTNANTGAPYQLAFAFNSADQLNQGGDNNMAFKLNEDGHIGKQYIEADIGKYFENSTFVVDNTKWHDITLVVQKTTNGSNRCFFYIDGEAPCASKYMEITANGENKLKDIEWYAYPHGTWGNSDIHIMIDDLKIFGGVGDGNANGLPVANAPVTLDFEDGSYGIMPTYANSSSYPVNQNSLKGYADIVKEATPSSGEETTFTKADLSEYFNDEFWCIKYLTDEYYPALNDSGNSIMAEKFHDESGKPVYDYEHDGVPFTLGEFAHTWGMSNLISAKGQEIALPNVPAGKIHLFVAASTFGNDAYTESTSFTIKYSSGEEDANLHTTVKSLPCWRNAPSGEDAKNVAIHKEKANPATGANDFYMYHRVIEVPEGSRQRELSSLVLPNNSDYRVFAITIESSKTSSNNVLELKRTPFADGEPRSNSWTLYPIGVMVFNPVKIPEYSAENRQYAYLDMDVKPMNTSDIGNLVVFVNGSQKQVCRDLYGDKAFSMRFGKDGHIQRSDGQWPNGMPQLYDANKWYKIRFAFYKDADGNTAFDFYLYNEKTGVYDKIMDGHSDSQGDQGYYINGGVKSSDNYISQLAFAVNDERNDDAVSNNTYSGVSLGVQVDNVKAYTEGMAEPPAEDAGFKVLDTIFAQKKDASTMWEGGSSNIEYYAVENIGNSRNGSCFIKVKNTTGENKRMQNILVAYSADEVLRDVVVLPSQEITTENSESVYKLDYSWNLEDHSNMNFRVFTFDDIATLRPILSK